MIRADDNLVILEPYMDGGESYEGHQKFSVLSRYVTEGECRLEQNWHGAKVTIPAYGNGCIKTIIPKENLSCFDTVVVKMQCAKEVRVILFFDEVKVLDTWGKGAIERHTENCDIGEVSVITYYFENTSKYPEYVVLHYLGAAIQKAVKIPFYTGNWEGCFAKEISFEPFTEDVLSAERLDRLRELVMEESFNAAYRLSRENALKRMQEKPENFIGKTLESGFRGNVYLEGVEDLALIGMLEKREDMIYMALRYALSASACTYWCCDEMEEIPAAVWHHRSFTEKNACHTVAVVISLCGNSLTWHGRNILYQALLIKGLPRIEADLMSMEYIYHMNQGVVFLSSYVQALLCLRHCYPRIEKKLKLAEEIYFEMLQNVKNLDGSMDEGAGYWDYTMHNILESAVYFAGYHGIGLKEYVGHMLDRASDFGLFLMDDQGEKVTYNDCHGGRWGNLVAGGLYLITGNPRWAMAYYQNPEHSLADVILLGCPEIPKLLGDFQNGRQVDRELEEYIDVGLLSVRRKNTRLLCIAGPSTSGHSHFDKGSFVLYHNGRQVLLDRGIGVYGETGGYYMMSSAAHNMAVPCDEGTELCQVRGAGYTAPYEYAYKDGKFWWQAEMTGMWDQNLVLRNTRTIESDGEKEYVITDEFMFAKEMSVAVHFHKAEKDCVHVEVCQGDIVREVNECDEAVSSLPYVCRQSFYTRAAKRVMVRTKVVLEKSISDY